MVSTRRSSADKGDDGKAGTSSGGDSQAKSRGAKRPVNNPETTTSAARSALESPKPPHSPKRLKRSNEGTAGTGDAASDVVLEEQTLDAVVAAAKEVASPPPNLGVEGLTEATIAGDLTPEPGKSASAPELLEPLQLVKNTLAALLKAGRQSSPSTPAGQTWGNLISQYPQHPHVALSGFCFTVGRSRGCSLVLKDPAISGILARLWFTNNMVVMENLGSNGVLSVNGKVLKKSSKVVLKSGDELTIAANKIYSFIFQQSATPVGSSPPPPLFSALEALVLPGNESARPRAVANEAVERKEPSAGVSEDGEDDQEVADGAATAPSSVAGEASAAMDLDAPTGGTDGAVTAPQSGPAAPTSVRRSSRRQTAKKGLAVEVSKVVEEALAGAKEGLVKGDKKSQGVAAAGLPPRPPADQGGSASTEAAIVGAVAAASAEIGMEGGTPRKPPKVPTPAGEEKDEENQAAAEARKQLYKEEFRKQIVEPKDVAVTFGDFPYYLSECTKQLLINSAFIHLKKAEFLKYTAELPSISPRLLLSGPAGSAIYQENLVKALAKHFHAKLLLFDPSVVAPEALDAQPTAGALSPEGEVGKGNGKGLDADLPPLSGTDLMETDGKDAAEIAEERAEWKANSEEAEAGPSDTRPVTADLKPSTPLGTAKGLLESSEGSPVPPTSVEKGEGKDGQQQGLSNLGRKAASGTGFTTTFKKGDRVKFAGGNGSGSIPATIHSYFIRLEGLETSKKLEPPSLRGPYVGCRGKVVMVFDENPRKVGVRFDKPIPGGNNLGNLCEDAHGFFCNVSDLRLEGTVGEDVDRLLMETLFELLAKESADGPVIMFLRDVEKAILANFERYLLFKKKLEKLEGRLVIIGSYTGSDSRKEKSHGVYIPKFGSNHTALMDLAFLQDSFSRLEDRAKDPPKASKMLSKLFPNKVTIQPPTEEGLLTEWKRQLDRDVETLKAEANRQHLRTVLSRSSVECEGLAAVAVKDQVLTPETAEKIVGWAVSHYLMNTAEPQLQNDKLLISAESLEHGVAMLHTIQSDNTPLKKSLKDVVTENEFEKRLLSEVIPPNEIGVSFNDIGALEAVKETLRELVMLPLQRPELFTKGQLTKPCKGILLFGPPGTGKTMLAKAVATEAGANFINISMSTIASKWFGEGEKYVKAVFTLASKIAPSVIFVDEVDSMLGRREKPGEHEAMRKIKNEFMACWDGLRTKDRERVLVLAATNRPFDLDEAVVRRLPRRLMVNLPDAENRGKVLRVILGKEELASDFDWSELAQLTDGYSGSDLKNLCVTAAYRPIREILEQERKDKEKAKAEGKEWVDIVAAEGKAPFIRPLNMEDMRQAKEQVCASVSQDAASMSELQQWNDLYGEGGSRKKTTLPYFM